jgi:hypothetical protein
MAGPRHRGKRVCRPVAIDLCCGRGGWSAGLIAAGWQVIGFDLEQWSDCAGVVVRADVGTLDHFTWADLIVASPPCTAFSRLDSPALYPHEPPPDMTLVNCCFSIAQRSGVPLVLENVRGLQRCIGTAVQHYGSFYLWGDGVPPLMPYIPGRAGRPRLKWGHKSAALRAKIPFELAYWIGQYHRNRLTLRADLSAGQIGPPLTAVPTSTDPARC